jgi:hypothetical protein
VYTASNIDLEVIDNFISLISFFAHQVDLLSEDRPLRCGLDRCSCGSEFENTDVLADKELPDDLVENRLSDDELFDSFGRRLAQNLDAYLKTSELAKLLLLVFLLNLSVPRSTLIWATNLYGNLVDTRVDANGYSAVVYSIANNKWDSVETLVKSGADLHHVGFDDDFSPIEESATSLALYSSGNFFEWRGILRALETDIEKFIENELQNGRLHRDGWNAEALQTLFRLEFSPRHRHEDCEDCACGNRVLVYKHDNIDEELNRDNDDDDKRCGNITDVMVEVDWRKLLERIKHGQNLGGYIDKYLEDSDSESWNSCDRDRDIVEISDAEGSEGDASEGEEENQQSSVAREEDIRGERVDEDIEDCWEDVSEDSEDDEDDYNSPEWFCITCWHSSLNSDASSTTTYEVESDAEDSPMLLKIGP